MAAATTTETTTRAVRFGGAVGPALSVTSPQRHLLAKSASSLQDPVASLVPTGGELGAARTPRGRRLIVVSWPRWTLLRLRHSFISRAPIDERCKCRPWCPAPNARPTRLTGPGPAARDSASKLADDKPAFEVSDSSCWLARKPTFWAQAPSSRRGLAS